MRHSLLNLESSDTGELTENEDSFLEDVFRDSFDETNDDGDEDHVDQDLTFDSADVISSTPVSQEHLLINLQVMFPLKFQHEQRNLQHQKHKECCLSRPAR